MPVNDALPDIVDGFTLSASLLYLPTTYRASALANMETLRRAKSYRNRAYVAADSQLNVIPAFKQVEYQVASLPGSYLWGLIFSVSAVENEEIITVEEAPAFIHVQVTDACTETPLFSDYTYGTMFLPSGPGTSNTSSFRNPFLITPRLLGQPALLDVELYNRSGTDITCQLVLFMAEPQIPPPQMEELLRKQGL